MLVKEVSLWLPSFSLTKDPFEPSTRPISVETNVSKCAPSICTIYIARGAPSSVPTCITCTFTNILEQTPPCITPCFFNFISSASGFIWQGPQHILTFDMKISSHYEFWVCLVTFINMIALTFHYDFSIILCQCFFQRWSRLCENVPKITWSRRICRGGDTVRKFIVKDKDKDKNKEKDRDKRAQLHIQRIY